MRVRHCWWNIEQFSAYILEPKQRFSNVVHKVVIAGDTVVSQLQEQFTSGRNFDTVGLQLLAYDLDTIENSTFGLFVLDVRFGDNRKIEFASQDKVWLSLGMYETTWCLG